MSQRAEVVVRCRACGFMVLWECLDPKLVVCWFEPEHGELLVQVETWDGEGYSGDRAAA